jgi:polysaccharide pyruvyl transferase WcaK-like protein
VSVTAHDPHAASILAAARWVAGRDKLSVKILQEAGCRAVYAPDIAMAHSGDANRGRARVRDWFAEEGLVEPGDYAVLAPLGYWTVRGNLGAHHSELALYAETVRALGMPCVLLAASTRKPDDRAACYLVREWSGAWRTTVVSRRTPELHDVIAGARCVVSSRLHPALLAVASDVPVVALSANPKVTETFASMGRGECVVDPAGARAEQIAAAVLEAQAIPATWEVEEASRSADGVLAEILR